jgi:hypothetical protein
LQRTHTTLQFDFKEFGAGARGDLRIILAYSIRGDPAGSTPNHRSFSSCFHAFIFMWCQYGTRTVRSRANRALYTYYYHHCILPVQASSNIGTHSTVLFLLLRRSDILGFSTVQASSNIGTQTWMDAHSHSKCKLILRINERKQRASIIHLRIHNRLRASSSSSMTNKTQ